MKSSNLLLALFVLATPALAFEIEEIGTIEATFDGESIAQPVVIARNNGDEDATAFMMSPGGGFTAFTLGGLNIDNMALGLVLGVEYFPSPPIPETVPVSVEITYKQTGDSGHWTSDEAPTAPSVTFTTLEFEGGEGRAAGSFAAVLCYAEDYGSGADTGNCRPIEGRFDTRFFVEE
jgi:hypothetical protein